MNGNDSHQGMVRRGELARSLDTALDASGVVFCGLGSSSRAWRDLDSARPAYYASDPMGLALPLAAGFAVARPDRTVALLVGDGDLLMGLNSLVTVTGAGVANLKVLVTANGRYETGGGRPLPGREVDIVALAVAAGWPSAAWAPGDLDAAVAETLSVDGPALLGVPVEVEAAPYGGPGRWSGIEERVLFETRLAETDDQEGHG